MIVPVSTSLLETHDCLVANSVFDPLLNTCVLSQKPDALIGVWSGMMAFDVFTIALAITNAFEIGRAHV